jgi:hypothetical protein
VPWNSGENRRGDVFPNVLSGMHLRVYIGWFAASAPNESSIFLDNRVRYAGRNPFNLSGANR